MRRIWFAIVIGAGALLGPLPATAGVIAHIDLSSQRMTVKVDGEVRHVWPVSTARPGYRTPIGSFRPQSMHVRHFSTLFHGSPMPHSIFFDGNFAIHGTYEIKNLGRRASHGCVRLHPNAARELFQLIQEHGPSNTEIVVTG